MEIPTNLPTSIRVSIYACEYYYSKMKDNDECVKLIEKLKNMKTLDDSMKKIIMPYLLNYSNYLSKLLEELDEEDQLSDVAEIYMFVKNIISI